ncbi:MAG: hypothetical protein J6Q22_09580 [Prevotella sp.]|nr:hypothetical protein [Prevotella sp.]
MSNPNDIVAVKLEGCFTEWYSPTYKDPYEDNADYRKYYDQHILDKQPVIGPAVSGEDDYISGDLQCVAERLCCDACDWDKTTEDLMDTVEMCLADGKPRTWKDTEGFVTDVKITPFKKCEMPPLTEDALKVFGDYGWLIRERYEAI